MSINDVYGRWFEQYEMECRCRCGYAAVKPELMERLNELRIKVGKPVNVTSACRCEQHNKNVGGVKNSYHMQGMAADIYVSDMELEDLAKAAESVGFNGIGIYIRQKFVHVDIRDKKQRWYE